MKLEVISDADKRIVAMVRGISVELSTLIKAAGPDQHPMLGTQYAEACLRVEDVIHRAGNVMSLLASRCDEVVEAKVAEALKKQGIVAAPADAPAGPGDIGAPVVDTGSVGKLVEMTDEPGK